MEFDDMQCHQAVLSIDIGGTAARGILAWRKGDEIQTQVLMFCPWDSDVDRKWYETSSTIRPFDDDPIKYICNDNIVQDKRGKMPIKFVPYVLLGKIKHTHHHHPIGNLLKKDRSKVGFNEAHFKAALETAFKEFLRFILMSAKKTLNMRKPDNLDIQIQTIAMAVPSQWDVTFRNLYERLLKEAFAAIRQELGPVFARDINVVFHTDATAIAHYFLHASSDANGLNLRNRGIIPNIDVVGGGINTQLFIHCGGYHTSSVLTTIQRDGSGKRVLCEAGRSHGAEGGTEWWIENLVALTCNIMTESYLSEGDFTPETLNHIRLMVMMDKEIIMGEQDHFLNLAPSKNGTSKNGSAGTLIGILLTKDDSDRAFDVSFRHIKRMLRQQLERVSSIKRGWATREHAITIVVTGGSALHPAFKAWMQESCEELGLPKAITLDNMAEFCGPAQVAQGAAYATLALQARSITASMDPRRSIPEFGSKEADANVERLRQLRLRNSKRDTATNARADDATKHSSNDNVSSSGEASSPRQKDSASEGPEAAVNQTASKKRKASVEPDDVTPAKHINITRELPIRTASSARMNTSSTGKDTSQIPEKRIHNTRGLAIRTASSMRKDTSSTNKDASSTREDGSST